MLKRFLVGSAAFLCLTSSAAWAAPIGFAFFQGGFQENAFLTGFAIGNDLNGDGRLGYGTPPLDLGVEPGVQEIQQFGLFFSGNSLVQRFTLPIEAFSQPPTLFSGFDEGFFFTVGLDRVAMMGQEWKSFLLPDACAGNPCLDFEFTGPGAFGVLGDSIRVNGGPGTSGRSTSFAPAQVARISGLIPEPSSLLLVILGLAVLCLLVGKKRSPIGIRTFTGEPHRQLLLVNVRLPATGGSATT